MRKKLLYISLVVSFTLLAYNIMAMPGPAGGSPPAGSAPAGTPVTGSPPAGGPPCWSPPCIPIDGGIGILLAAGAFVGARKIYQNGKKSVD